VKKILRGKGSGGKCGGVPLSVAKSGFQEVQKVTFAERLKAPDCTRTKILDSS